MTKELRERLYEKFKSYYDRGAGYEIIEMEMLALLEQEILEAERRGREEMRKECLACVPNEKDEYIEAFDNDGHRFAIPRSKRDEWYKWCEIPSDDEKSWEVPDFGVELDPEEEFDDNRQYNKTVADVRKSISSLK